MSGNILTDKEMNELWDQAERELPCNGRNCLRYDGDVNHSGDCSAWRRSSLYKSLKAVAERFKKG